MAQESRALEGLQYKSGGCGGSGGSGESGESGENIKSPARQGFLRKSGLG
jgi:hypothetical protein